MAVLLGHGHGCPYPTRIQVSDLKSFLLDTANNTGIDNVANLGRLIWQKKGKGDHVTLLEASGCENYAHSFPERKSLSQYIMYVLFNFL